MEYRHFTSKAEAHKAFNSLAGIVKGINIDRKINEREIKALDKWCELHEFLAKRNPFSDVITNIQVIIEDGNADQDAIDDMLWLCEKFQNEFSYYDIYTSDMQELQGICHGILADAEVNEDELRNLHKWMWENQHLVSYFPFDEIFTLLNDILSDGVVDKNEVKLFKAYINEFVILPDDVKREILSDIEGIDINLIVASSPQLDIDGAQFSVSGGFSLGSRKEVINKISDLGGKFINHVSSNTKYLFVGDKGNVCWTYACYGRKVETAMDLRKKGHNILIIHERDLLDELY